MSTTLKSSASSDGGSLPKGQSALPQLTITTITSEIPSKEASSPITTPSAAHIERRDMQPCSPSSLRACATRDPFDTDLEAMSCPVQCSRSASSCKLGRRSTANDCQAWPSKEQWKERAKEAKLRRRTCTCLAQLDKRTRISIQLLVLLLVIGAAVGIGVGISKKLNQPIYGDQNNHPSS